MTPPYLFIAFALSSLLVSLMASGYDLLGAENVKLAVVDVLAMLIPGTFVCLAGTLPLKPYRPSLNVAQPKDVRKLFSLILVLTRKSADTIRYTLMSRR